MHSSLSDREPLRFDAFMEVALYSEPGGFYASGRGAGRRGGDFVTSVEVGPLFGRLIARLADRCWEQLGSPGAFTLVDAGAGRGTLARSVLRAAPECAPALRYVLVERSDALRGGHRPLLERPPGPCAALESRADLPSGRFDGLVVANELFDNLPVRLLERTAAGWEEVWVAPPAAAVPTGAPPSRPTEVLVPVPPKVAARADALAPAAPLGGRIPLAWGAVAWVGRVLGLLRRGALVALDYTDSSASLAARPAGEWLRTYRDGVRGHDPLVAPGSADITCEVPLDQLLAAHPGAEVCEQAGFLRRLGIDDLVVEGRSVWSDRAGVGDLAALEARSSIGEAEALCDPSGLGAFTVAIWQV